MIEKLPAALTTAPPWLVESPNRMICLISAFRFS
jgi:hypothetical protein